MQLCFLLAILLSSSALKAQDKTISRIRNELEKSTNPPLYAKSVLKKSIVLDTITIRHLTSFRGRVDSLAYHGKTGKVYGPFDNGRVLVQILAKSPNTFYKISQIFIDSSVFTQKFADSLSAEILLKIRDNKSGFEEQAAIYSMGGEAATKGELGWVASGALLPGIEAELKKRKKGDLFRIWTKTGLHIIRKDEDDKKDTGYVLLMRVLL